MVTASIMNTHVRDNLLASAPHLVVRKTSDQSVTNSTALVNDTALVMAVAANEIWRVEFNILHVGPGGLRTAFTFPASGNIAFAAHGDDGGGTDRTGYSVGTTTPSSTWQWQSDSGSNIRVLSWYGVFVNAGTAGNLQLQWAQSTLNATATNVKANSTLWAVKLA